MGWIAQYVLPQVGGDLFQLRYSLRVETHDAVLDAPSCTKIPVMSRSFELILAAAEHVNTGNSAFTCCVFIPAKGRYPSHRQRQVTSKVQRRVPASAKRQASSRSSEY